MKVTRFDLYERVESYAAHENFVRQFITESHIHPFLKRLVKGIIVSFAFSEGKVELKPSIVQSQLQCFF